MSLFKQYKPKAGGATWQFNSEDTLLVVRKIMIPGSYLFRRNLSFWHDASHKLFILRNYMDKMAPFYAFNGAHF